MTTKLQTLIEAAQEPLEKLSLISFVSQSLCHNYQQTQTAVDFWEPQTLERLIHAQQTQPITDIARLGGNFWPEDESANDFIEYIYQQPILPFDIALCRFSYTICHLSPTIPLTLR